MTELGKIDWQRYDEQDEATHPRPTQALLVIARKNGEVSVFTNCYFNVRYDRFRALVPAESPRAVWWSDTCVMCVEHKVSEYDDVAWAYLDVPSWWHAKEKEE